MTAQSEQALENGLISSLQDMSYEYVQVKEETNLYSNFKKQLEKHNAKALAEIGRTTFTDKEFEKIGTYFSFAPCIPETSAQKQSNNCI